MSTICSLVQIDLRAVEGINDMACLTDGPFDVVYDGRTYYAFGALLKIDAVSTENSLSNKTMKVTLSGIDEQFQKLVAETHFRNKPISIIKALVPDETNVVSEAEVYYRGITETPEISVDYNSGTFTTGVSCKSVYDLSQKPHLSRANNATHQLFHPGDLFFQYANQSDRPDEMWRRA
ncbi:hypothetical protein ACK3Z8_00870 [Aeromonas caviae]